MKTAIIIVLIVVITAVTSGSYYYYRIYQPRQYVRQITAALDPLQAQGFKPGIASLKDKDDYPALAILLDERVVLLAKLSHDLVAISAPVRFAEIHEEIKNFIQFLFDQHNRAQERALFFSKAHILLTNFQALKNMDAAQDSRSIVTVGDFQQFWHKHIAQIQLTGKKLFPVSQSILGSASSTELTTAWNAASSGLDTLLGIINSVNPRLKLEQAGNVLSSLSQKKFQDATLAIDRFYRLLEVTLRGGNAYNIATFSFSSLSQTEMSERIFTFSQRIEHLKKIYAR